MELNIKAHDITKRADKSLRGSRLIDIKDYNRLDYLISRFRKHSKKLSNEIQQYKDIWEKIAKKSKRQKLSKTECTRIENRIEKKLLERSENIRERADKLLK